MFMLSVRGWTLTIYNGGKLILILMNENIKQLQGVPEKMSVYKKVTSAHKWTFFLGHLVESFYY